jgi:hypothetical protein
MPCCLFACAQVIGVGASVIGDMSSRPNWGLNELDFVFATLVVSSQMLCGWWFQSCKLAGREAACHAEGTAVAPAVAAA